MKRILAGLLAIAMMAPLLREAHAQEARLSTARELQWVDVDRPKGARQAVLWGDPKTSESGVLMRWPFNSKLEEQVRNQDVRILVLQGTFTVDLGGTYKEFGPSGVIVIPRGTKHVLGCEAAGECRFLVQHPGAVEVSKSK